MHSFAYRYVQCSIEPALTGEKTYSAWECTRKKKAWSPVGNTITMWGINKMRKLRGNANVWTHVIIQISECLSLILSSFSFLPSTLVELASP
jgi:hypothetical protein